MSTNSTNFEFRFLKDSTNVYLCGIHIATVEKNSVTYHYVGDGENGKIDLNKIPGCLFKGRDDLCAAIREVTGKLDRILLPNE